MIPIVHIPLSSELSKRGGSTYGVVYSNRKLSLSLVKILLHRSIFHGIKVYEYYCIHLYIHAKWSTLSEIEKLSSVALLSLCSKRRRPLLQWESNLRKTLSEVRNYLREDILGRKQNFLDFLVENHLIVKDPSLVTDFRISYKYHKLPLPVAAIGVGYKDKGSSTLPLGYDPSADTRLLTSRPLDLQERPSLDEGLDPSKVALSWANLLRLNHKDGPEPDLR